MTAWWERDPIRWEREQNALRSAGVAFEVNPGARASSKLVLNLSMQSAAGPLKLVAHFPTTYPYFPPAVEAPELDLPRHQTPGAKTLCLLKDNGADWEPATDTLAGLLVEQLPKIFASQPGTADKVSEVEVHDGEPITAFIATEEGSFIGFPSYAFDRLPEQGTFLFGMDSLQPLRGTVVELRDEAGTALVPSQARDESYYQQRGLPLLVGRWTKLAERPRVADAKAYYDIATQTQPSLQQPHWQPVAATPKARIDLLALLFEDELAWREYAGNAIVISKTQSLAMADKHQKVLPRVHRVELESRANYFVRDPAASGLQQGTVALVGTGSIGSPAAKLLAQSGIGTLRLLDQDILDAGNAIRWEVGRSGAGRPKVQVLTDLITANFPYTSLAAWHGRVGNPMTTVGEDRRVDELLFRNVSCLFDASASIPVNQFLSETARNHGVPYVWMHATHGGWAGLVGRAGPAREDLCWGCHMYYLDDAERGVGAGDVKLGPLPSAPADDRVQPPGCLDPTFVGAQVDLLEVSLMGVRRVIDEVMLRVGKQGNSAYDWNVAVVTLRDADGRPQLPAWTPYRLPVHVNCPNH